MRPVSLIIKSALNLVHGCEQRNLSVAGKYLQTGSCQSALITVLFKLVGKLFEESV
jgi:hypothetical protein